MNRQHHFSQKHSRKPTLHLVIGNRAVMEVLHHKAKHISVLYLAKGEKLLSDDIRKMVNETKIKVETLSKDELTALTGTDSHQGIGALMKGESRLSLDEFIIKAKREERSFMVALDSIFDPQNLGAILRASECFGASAVMWSKNRGADLTPSATKASAGASELMDIIKVSNLAESLTLLRGAGFEIVAADAAVDATPLNQFRFDKKTVLILGSEGEGIRPLLLKLADHKVYIPMQGKIDSLNVSQAAATILSWWSLTV